MPTVSMTGRDEDSFDTGTPDLSGPTFGASSPSATSSDPYGYYKTTQPYQRVGAAYKEYLGRDASPDDILSHLGGGKLTSDQSVTWAIKNIMNSPEAWATGWRSPTWGKTATPAANPTAHNQEGNTLTKQQFIASTIASGVSEEEARRTADYIYGPDATTTTTTTGGNGGNGGGGGNPTYQASQPQVGGNTPVFSDPATKEWENALRGLVDKLNQPINVPDYDPMVTYMRDFIKKLQQPAYSPNQMDLIQTQALDPMERQRTAARNQVVQRLAARGIAPSSGVVEQALQDVDRQFNELRTTTQSRFATQAIGMDRENADHAAQLAAQLTGIESGMHSANMGQQKQAVDLLFQLPQFANQRLQLALQTLGAGQPNTGLFSSLQGFQQQGINQGNQDQDYWANIGQMIARLIAGGG